jgi:hypothetical protein
MTPLLASFRLMRRRQPSRRVRQPRRTRGSEDPCGLNRSTGFRRAIRGRRVRQSRRNLETRYTGMSLPRTGDNAGQLEEQPWEVIECRRPPPPPAVVEKPPLGGSSAATVYAPSSNTNLELIATLYDVAPDGTATKITDGVVLGSQRQLDPRLSWYDAAGDPGLPGADPRGLSCARKAVQARYPLLPQQWDITPGDSLRLTLTTQELTTLCATTPFSTEPCYTPPPGADAPGWDLLDPDRAAAPVGPDSPPAAVQQFRTANSGVTPTSSGIVEPLDWGPEVPSWRW